MLPLRSGAHTHRHTHTLPPHVLGSPILLSIRIQTTPADVFTLRACWNSRRQLSFAFLALFTWNIEIRDGSKFRCIQTPKSVFLDLMAHVHTKEEKWKKGRKCLPSSCRCVWWIWELSLCCRYLKKWFSKLLTDHKNLRSQNQVSQTVATIAIKVDQAY